jgi:N-acetylmuramoyl-L-alanine amidase
MMNFIKSFFVKKANINEPVETIEVIEPTQSKTLFISAGHSHKDPGATGNGYTEADIVLEFRDLLASELEKIGVGFTMDGEIGQNLPLAQAIQFAKQHDLSIEFHCNAFNKPTATGCETLSADHFEFCTKLNELISKTLGIPNRGSKGEGSGQHSRLGFISKGHGIIVELFFISNPNDLESYQINKFVLANQIAQLIKDEVFE